MSQYLEALEREKGDYTVSSVPSFRSHEELLEYLDGHNRKQITDNTMVCLLGGVIHICFHDTVILKFYEDDTVQLFTHGWNTVTTKRRMNMFLPEGFYVHSRQNQWYVNDWTFEDGMVIETASFKE